MNNSYKYFIQSEISSNTHLSKLYNIKKRPENSQIMKADALNRGI